MESKCNVQLKEGLRLGKRELLRRRDDIKPSEPRMKVHNLICFLILSEYTALSVSFVYLKLLFIKSANYIYTPHHIFHMNHTPCCFCYDNIFLYLVFAVKIYFLTQLDETKVINLQ